MYWVVPWMNYAQLEIYLFDVFVGRVSISWENTMGFMLLLRAMLVHSRLCKSMKRCLVTVKMWITIIAALVCKAKARVKAWILISKCRFEYG